MKKLSTTILALCIVTVGASTQSMAEQLSNATTSKSITQKGNSKIEFPTNLTSKQFSKKLIKQVYPQAIYENGDFLLEDYAIHFSFKDIFSENGEKRYAYMFQSSGESLTDDAPDMHLFVFTKKSDSWVLEQQISGRPEKMEEYASLRSIDIVSLGKNRLGFVLFTQDGGSAGEQSNTYWIYDINGQLKTLSACSSSSWRFSELDIECEDNIRSDVASTSGFYSIELSYNLTKYDVIKDAYDYDNVPKGYDWLGGGNARKKIGSRKGAVLVKFDEGKQEYVFPASFEKILNTDNKNTSFENILNMNNKYWEYFK